MFTGGNTMNIAVMTDSNSGITQEKAKELGIFVVPMPFTINKESFLEDITLTQEEFYHKLEDENTQIMTSQPAIGDLTKYWRSALESHDAIIYIPMSSGLSGSCQTAMMLSDDEEFEGKVFVLDTHRISVTQEQNVLDAIKLVKEGKSVEEICETITSHKSDASIYITVPTLKYLKRGGRITPAAAAIGNLLKIKPILYVGGEKLDKFEQARTIKKARKIMIEAIKNDIEKKQFDDYELYIAYTKDLDQAMDFKSEVEETLNHKVETVAPLSLSVSCHIGPGAIALAVAKKYVK
jgi:DegV family protein with EDD domain